MLVRERQRARVVVSDAMCRRPRRGDERQDLILVTRGLVTIMANEDEDEDEDETSLGIHLPGRVRHVPYHTHDNAAGTPRSLVR